MAQDKSLEELAGRVEQFRTILLHPNAQALEEILADSLSYGHSDGLVENKATMIGSFLSGHHAFTSLEISQQSISIDGNVALVRHRLSGQANDDGKPAKVDIFVLLIFKQEHHTWKLLARQAVKVPIH